MGRAVPATEVAVLEEHSDGIVQVDFGADATQLVSASWDETAIVWDLDRSMPRQDAARRPSDRGRLERLGNLIAIGGEDGSVQFRDPATGIELHETEQNEHAMMVNDIAFDAAGAVLVSASEDRSPWSSGMPKPVRSIIASGRERRPGGWPFGTDADRVIVGDGTCHLVFLDGDALLDAAQAQTTRELTETSAAVSSVPTPNARQGLAPRRCLLLLVGCGEPTETAGRSGFLSGRRGAGVEPTSPRPRPS